jgi:predicted amidohydrolase
MNKIRFGVYQSSPKLGDIEANTNVVCAKIEEAAVLGLKLLVFPECALCGYDVESREELLEFSISRDHRAIRQIEEAAISCDMEVIFGFLERDGSSVFNSAYVASDCVNNHVYRKVHLPLMGADRFAEKGDLGFPVFDLKVGRVGVNICYDQSFPESARVLALAGAELIVLPTNWATGARNACEILTNARALENKVFYVSADRVGSCRGTTYIGTSRIVDCEGSTLVQAGDEEGFIWAEEDLSLAREKHVVVVPGRHEVNRIGDRRPEEYSRLLS